MRELRARSAAFSGARSLMRVRATAKGKVERFQAQLEVDRGDSMRLKIFTPLGTTAATIAASGNRIRTSDARGAAWEGTAEEFAGSYGLFSAAILPSDLARLILGLPVEGTVEYDTAATGLRSARAGDVTVTFDPPVFPPSRVVVRRGDDVAEIEHIEIVSR